MSMQRATVVEKIRNMGPMSGGASKGVAGPESRTAGRGRGGGSFASAINSDLPNWAFQIRNFPIRTFSIGNFSIGQ